jgi:hypothetical protein
MGRAIHRATKAFHPDIDTAGLSAVEYIIDPDLSGVSGVPHVYWKLVGDSVVQMSRPERDAADINTRVITDASAVAIATAAGVANIAAARGSAPIDPAATSEERLRAVERKLYGA